MKKNLLLALISLILSLLIAEVVCRYSGKYASYSELTGRGAYISPYNSGNEKRYHVLPPHTVYRQTEKEFVMQWATNNEGFRDTDFAAAKTKPRIVVMGDSYAEGIGADNDSTFPKQLSYLLNDSFSTDTEVWNAGVSGSDPFYEFVVLRDRLLKYKPDMVIAIINISDVYETIVRGGFERFKPDGKIQYHSPPWFEPLYAKSFLVRRVIHDVCRYDRQLISPFSQKQTTQTAYEKLCSAMEDFDTLCRKQNIRLLFVFHPIQKEAEKNMAYQVQPLIDYCRDKNFACVDVREQFYKMGIEGAAVSSLYWKSDGHFNNTGYNYFAQSGLEKVIGELQY